MGAQPSTEGAPEEAEGGGSEGHGHETASAPTVEAEMGGGTDKGDVRAGSGDGRVSLESASTAPSSSVEGRLSLESASTAPSIGCSAQGDDKAGEGPLITSGLSDEDRSAADGGRPDGGEASEGHNVKEDGGGADAGAEEEPDAGCDAADEAQKTDVAFTLEAEGGQPGGDKPKGDQPEAGIPHKNGGDAGGGTEEEAEPGRGAADADKKEDAAVSLEAEGGQPEGNQPEADSPNEDGGGAIGDEEEAEPGRGAADADYKKDPSIPLEAEGGQPKGDQPEGDQLKGDKPEGGQPEVDNPPKDGGGADGGAEVETEAECGTADAEEKKDATLTLEAGGDQPEVGSDVQGAGGDRSGAGSASEGEGQPEAGECSQEVDSTGSGQEAPVIAPTSDSGEAHDGGDDPEASVVLTSVVVPAPLPTVADSPAGDDPGKREGSGSDMQIEGAGGMPLPGIAQLGDAGETPASGTAEDAVVARKAAAVEAAKAALRIAISSGLASPSEMRTISLCSREACRLCREGRTFHIKVTANTPLHVWSPPSPPPPLVGDSSRQPWGGESDAHGPPPRFSRAAAAAGGGLRGPSEAPWGKKAGADAPTRYARAAAGDGIGEFSEAPSSGGGQGGRPLARTGAGFDESSGLSSVGVTPAKNSAAEIARGRTGNDPRLGGVARPEKGVTPLRVSHITWDRPEQDLGGEFARELPLDLETLTFAFAFNGSVDGVEVDWPPGMKALHFGMAFNPRPEPVVVKPGVRGAAGGGSGRGGSLSPRPALGGRGRAASVALGGGGRWSKFLPPGLEEVSFGTHFNQPVEGVKWPSRLKRLLFGANFKQNIEVADWPDSLEELTFGVYFNQPVERVKWPTSLKRLEFGTGFNQPVEKCSFPDGLEDITFGTHFNQTIAAVKWPPGLLRVTFGDRFNKPVASAAWPASLTHLTFGRGFDQPLQGPRLTAPPSGGDAPGWPPAGLVSVIVGSKFTGDAVPVEEGGVGGGKSERRMGETGFPIFRRFSPKRSKRRGSGRGIGGGRSGSTKVGQDKGDGGASTLVASSESASTPTEKRAGGRFSSLKR